MKKVVAVGWVLGSMVAGVAGVAHAGNAAPMQETAPAGSANIGTSSSKQADAAMQPGLNADKGQATNGSDTATAGTASSGGGNVSGQDAGSSSGSTRPDTAADPAERPAIPSGR